jgi:hypothetical protein
MESARAQDGRLPIGRARQVVANRGALTKVDNSTGRVTGHVEIDLYHHILDKLVVV